MVREKLPALPPSWVVMLGSLLILAHLYCALASSLSVYSGPWPAPNNMGVSEARAPEFAITAYTGPADYYQRIVKTTVPFRFGTILQEQPEYSMIATLRDTSGKVVGKRSLPDPEASAGIQYRQQLLARQLSMDVGMEPLGALEVAAPGKTLPKLSYWLPDGDRKLKLVEQDKNSIERNRPFNQPAAWHLLVAKSYIRFLERENPNTRVELVRQVYDPILPIVLIEPESFLPEFLRSIQSSYGELRP